MLIEEKVFGFEAFDGGVEGVVIEQNGAEDGAFGVEVLWEGAFESRGGGHFGTLCDSLFLRFRYNTQFSDEQAGFLQHNKIIWLACNPNVACIVSGNERRVNGSRL